MYISAVIFTLSILTVELISHSPNILRICDTNYYPFHISVIYSYISIVFSLIFSLVFFFLHFHFHSFPSHIRLNFNASEWSFAASTDENTLKQLAALMSPVLASYLKGSSCNNKYWLHCENSVTSLHGEGTTKQAIRWARKNLKQTVTVQHIQDTYITLLPARLIASFVIHHHLLLFSSSTSFL